MLLHCLDTKCFQWPLLLKFMDTCLGQCSPPATATKAIFADIWIFKTVNFQFKTGQNFDHCRWKDAEFWKTNEIIHLKICQITQIFAKYLFSFLLCFVSLQPCYQLYKSGAVLHLHGNECMNANINVIVAEDISHYYSTAVYVSHGLSMRQRDPQQQTLLSKMTYSSILHCPGIEPR